MKLRFMSESLIISSTLLIISSAISHEMIVFSPPIRLRFACWCLKAVGFSTEESRKCLF